MLSHRRVRPRPLLWEYDQLRAYGRFDTRWTETLGYVYEAHGLPQAHGLRFSSQLSRLADRAPSRG